MNRFEKWWMKRILAKQVRQGWDHDKRITEMYAMVSEAVEEEFTEDNTPTRNHFLQECFENSLKKN